MSEHLYRDEVGAAVERLAQLENENARLRAELARRSPSPHNDPHARAAGALIVLLAGALAFAGLSLRGGSCHRGGERRSHVLASHRSGAGGDTRATVRAGGPALAEIRGGDDCSIPFFYDANNVKRPKTACRGLADSPDRR